MAQNGAQMTVFVAADWAMDTGVDSDRVYDDLLPAPMAGSDV